LNDHGDRLPVIIVNLLRGIIYREDDQRRWQDLVELQGPVQDYLGVIGLELCLYDDEGFAFLKNRERNDEEPDFPQLIIRRQLSYTVSLLLAQLRRALAEHDASSSDERLIIDREELISIMQTFFEAGTNEVKFRRKIEASLQKVFELGFIRFIGDRKEKIEVKRIIKAFVDAQWLNEFDQRIGEYLEYAGGSGEEPEGDDE